MMRGGIVSIFFLLLLISSCRDPYQPPVIAGQSNLLVVDGFLDGGDSSCMVVLSRSQNLSDSEEPLMEKNANVQLEDDAGNRYSLLEISGGNYSLSNLNVDLQKRYRLSIKTESGNSYLSDYVEIKRTPPIDSVTWKATNQGIQFYVSTHDDEKKSIYYQFRYVETWEHTSAFQSVFKYQSGAAVLRTEDIYHCWTTMPSTKISIATSAKLNDDIISQYPLTLIPKYSEKYLIRYSILVKQNVLTNEAYNYWQQLQKNTEKLGTLFDPQPSQIVSNIQNVNNSAEPVLGYFSAGMSTEKRIFVEFRELPDGFGFLDDHGCKLDTILLADLSTHGGFGELACTVTLGRIILIVYSPSTSECVDCRDSGGLNMKPGFW